jgi:heme-degrading monooxygenase HmoA
MDANGLGSPAVREVFQMIARKWRGLATAEKADEYVRHLQQSVIPDLNRIDGFEGVYLLRPALSDNVEFVVLTLWVSMDAIRRFAGDTPEMAVAAKEARAILLDYDPMFSHPEVLVSLKLDR